MLLRFLFLALPVVAVVAEPTPEGCHACVSSVTVTARAAEQLMRHGDYSASMAAMGTRRLDDMMAGACARFSGAQRQKCDTLLPGAAGIANRAFHDAISRRLPIDAVCEHARLCEKGGAARVTDGLRKVPPPAHVSTVFEKHDDDLRTKRTLRAHDPRASAVSTCAPVGGSHASTRRWYLDPSCFHALCRPLHADMHARFTARSIQGSPRTGRRGVGRSKGNGNDKDKDVGDKAGIGRASPSALADKAATPVASTDCFCPEEAYGVAAKSTFRAAELGGESGAASCAQVGEGCIADGRSAGRCLCPPSHFRDLPVPSGRREYFRHDGAGPDGPSFAHGGCWCARCVVAKSQRTGGGMCMCPHSCYAEHNHAQAAMAEAIGAQRAKRHAKGSSNDSNNNDSNTEKDGGKVHKKSKKTARRVKRKGHGRSNRAGKNTRR